MVGGVGQQLVAVVAVGLSACSGDIPAQALDGGTDGSPEAAARVAEAAATALVDAPSVPPTTSSSGRSCESHGIIDLNQSVVGVAVHFDGGEPDESDAASPCVLAGPCVVETYRTPIAQGTITCSPDGRWWSYADARAFGRESNQSEAVYLDGRLCYQFSRVLFGVGLPGPTVMKTDSKGIPPAVPACEPGCCPL
jgi:hypothetical protein